MSEEEEVDWDWFPFEGLDFRTKPPYCGHCCKHLMNACFLVHIDQPVQMCSGCRLAYYCSRDCQVADRSNHKRACKTIKKQRELVQREEDVARSKGYFETHVGDLWDVAFPYCKARYDLALLIHPAAYQSNIIESWKEMNMHFQELLRLVHNFEGYDYGLATKFPTFLLHEGRDDDAYAYVRYYMRRWYSGPMVDPSLLTLYERTNQGDWIYPREQGCRFNNFFEECPNIIPEFCDVKLLVVIWLVKKRLLCMAIARDKAFQCFVATSSGGSLVERNHDVGYHILSFLIDYDFDDPAEYGPWLDVQNAQLDELSDRIDIINPDLLPNFANAREILSQPTPALYELNYGMGQVWGLLNDCHKHLDTLPGLENWIAHRYGRERS